MATKKTSTSGGTAKKSGGTAKKSSSTRTKSAAAERKPTTRSRSSASDSDGGRARKAAPKAAAPRQLTGIQVAAQAARQLLELTGRDVEGVTGLEKTDDGWKVHVEVVEVRRIPDTTDVLAVYELDVNSDGDLEGYRRLRRHTRGVPGQERP